MKTEDLGTASSEEIEDTIARIRKEASAQLEALQEELRRRALEGRSACASAGVGADGAQNEIRLIPRGRPYGESLKVELNTAHFPDGRRSLTFLVLREPETLRSLAKVLLKNAEAIEAEK